MAEVVQSLAPVALPAKARQPGWNAGDAPSAERLSAGDAAPDSSTHPAPGTDRESSPSPQAAPAAIPWLAIGLIAVLLVGLNLLVAWLEPALLRLARYDVQPSAAQIVVLHEAPTSDVLIMGSSRALFGLDPAIVQAELPRLIGGQPRALNVAFAAGATDMSYLTLKRALRQGKVPAVIVYGLAEFELMKVPSYHPERFPYFNLLLHWEDFATYGGQSFSQRLAFVLDRLCPLCRDRELIRVALSVAVNPDDPAHRVFATPRGWRPGASGHLTWPPTLPLTPRVLEANRRAMRAYLRDFRFDHFRLRRLHDLLALARARDIRVILVNMPVTPAVHQLWDDEPSIARFAQVAGDIAAGHGATFVDLYRQPSVPLPEASFVDDHHLSRTGATAVTRFLTTRFVAQQLRDARSAVH